MRPSRGPLATQIDGLASWAREFERRGMVDEAVRMRAAIEALNEAYSHFHGKAVEMLEEK
jgi:hypothetical protein